VNALVTTAVVVPARDEAGAIGAVVAELRAAGAMRVIVVDNGSSDGTDQIAAQAGAEVVHEARPGYGWSCAAGLRAATGCDRIGFIDGDGSFAARDLACLADLVASGDADLALGKRDGGLSLQQRGGNALVLAALHALYGVALPDVAPLRVVRTDLLDALEMGGSRYAWLVEMLAKAARRRARIAVRPVRYGARVGGRSKVSGTLRGSALAGLDFLRALIEFRDW